MESDSISVTESTTKFIKQGKFDSNAIDSCTSTGAPVISIHSAPFSTVSKCLSVHAFAFGEAIPSFTISRTETTDKHILPHTHLLSVCLTEVILRVMTWGGRGEDSFCLCTETG